MASRLKVEVVKFTNGFNVLNASFLNEKKKRKKKLK